MAENTLLQRENDYQNKREYLEHHSNLANTKLKKTVMHKIFSKTTLNCAKKSGCMKYFSTYNLFSVLLPNIYIAVFWTLCQCMIGSVTTSSTNINDSVILAVNYVGYLHKESFDRTTLNDETVNYSNQPKTLDILLKVEGNNIDKINSFKISQGNKLCNDSADIVFKSKYEYWEPFGGSRQNVDVLFTIVLTESITDRNWFLCIPSADDSSKEFSYNHHETYWVNTGHSAVFRLPSIKTLLRNDQLSNHIISTTNHVQNTKVLAENYKSHSTNRVSQYREERSAQNKEESGAIFTGTSKSKQDVDNPQRRSRILAMHLSKIEKDKMFYEDHGIITLRSGKEVNNLMIYGYGLKNSSTLKFTSSSFDFGSDCKTHDEMHVKTHSLNITVLKDDGTLAEVNIPSDALISVGGETSYYICLSTEDGLEEFTHQGQDNALRINVFAPLLPLWLMIICLVVLLCLSGLFSGLNLGLMALDQTELKIVQNTGSEKEKRYAKSIVPVRAHGNFLLCSLLLGNVLVNSTLTIFMEALSSGLVAVIGSTMGIVIFGEIIPQALCSRHALFVGASTIWLTKMFMALTFPLSFPISLILDKILGDELGTVYDKKKLIELLRITNENNDLEKDEVDIVTGALIYKEKTVKHIMTFIQDCYMLPLKSVLNFETVSEIREQGYSRIPVFEGDRSNILHILFAKDLMFIDPDDNMPLAMVCEFYNNEVNFVYADTPLNVMFNEFKSGEKGHMAFVQEVNASGEGDPFYETIGLVTLEDIIEEIIQQEIVDETDVVLDNRMKKKRKGRNQEMIGGGNYPIMQGDNAKRIRISPQVTLAVFQYLTTSIEPFKNEFLAKVVLEKLLTMDIYREVKLKSATKFNNSDDELILVRKGKPINYFILIIEGRVEVNIGREELMFESGPFSYFGIQALSQVLPSITSGLPTDSPSSPNVAIKNLAGASVHSAISNRTDSEHTIPAMVGNKVGESGDSVVAVKSASALLRKGSTQISLESPAINALANNNTNINKRGSSGTAGSIGDQGNSNYQPFVPDYTIKAVADVVYAKINRATYLRALKASKMTRKQSISSEMIDKHLDDHFLDKVNEDEDSNILVTQGTPLQLRSPERHEASIQKECSILTDKSNLPKKPINVYTNPANGPVSMKLDGGQQLNITVSGASSDCDGASENSSSRLMGGQDSNNSSFREKFENTRTQNNGTKSETDNNCYAEKEPTEEIAISKNILDSSTNGAKLECSESKTTLQSDAEHVSELENNGGGSKAGLLEYKGTSGAS